VSKTSNKLILLGTLILGLLFILFQVSKTQADGGVGMTSSSNQVGTTTNLDAIFANGRCGDLTKTFDTVIIGSISLENWPLDAVDFSDATVEVSINQQLVPGRVTQSVRNMIYWTPDSGTYPIVSNQLHQVKVNGVDITDPDLVGFYVEFYYQGNTLNVGYPICFGWSYGDSVNSCTEFDPTCFIKRFNETGVIPTPTPRPTFALSPTPAVTSTPTPIRTPTPTWLPTATPIPTLTPVSMEELGFVNQGPVEVWVTPGQTTSAFNLISVTATQFTFLGYPTSYGPGINTTPASGGTVPGRSTSVGIQVNSNVPAGSYSGIQRLITTDQQQYAVIPFTVHVGQFEPTATPTPTVTSTPTPTSPPIVTVTPTIIPTPVPLSIFSVSGVATSSRTARVTWLTSVPATSVVQYGLKSNQLNQYAPENPALVTSHLVDLSNLQPGKKYFYQVHSRSLSGEWVISSINIFNTPKK